LLQVIINCEKVTMHQGQGRETRAAGPWVGAAGAVVLALMGHLEAARAQLIVTPEITKGQTKLESLTELQGATHRDGAAVQSFNAAYGFTDNFQLNAFLIFERPRHDDLRVQSTALESMIELMDAARSGGFGLSWLTTVTAGLHGDETNSVIFGPVMRI